MANIGTVLTALALWCIMIEREWLAPSKQL